MIRPAKDVHGIDDTCCHSPLVVNQAPAIFTLSEIDRGDDLNDRVEVDSKSHLGSVDDELQTRLRKVERIAHLMDEAIRIPGTNIRVGWDALIGLFPGLGDVIAALPHLYLLRTAHRLGVRKRVLVKMLIHAGVDLLVGVVPVVGDILDIFWKANRKNADLIRREIERQAE